MAQQREGLADIPHVPDIGGRADRHAARGAKRPHDAFALRWVHPRRFHRDASAERLLGGARSGWTSTTPMTAHPSNIARAIRSMDSPTGPMRPPTRSSAGRRPLLALYVFAFVAAFTQIVLGSEPMKLATLGLAFLAYLFVRKGTTSENRYQDIARSPGLRVRSLERRRAGRRDRRAALPAPAGRGCNGSGWRAAACEWYDAGETPVDEKRAIAWVADSGATSIAAHVASSDARSRAACWRRSSPSAIGAVAP